MSKKGFHMRKFEFLTTFNIKKNNNYEKQKIPTHQKNQFVVRETCD